MGEHIGNQERTSNNGDSTSARTKVSNLAMQNKAGICLAIAGAALGFIIGNPLLALAGLASGFVAGSVAIDGDRSLVGGFIGGREQLAPAVDLPIANDTVTLAEQPSVLPPASAIPPLNGVTLDQGFSQQNGTLVATPAALSKRSERHRR